MLVRREGEGALCIGQASHAWLSGQLARAWGNGSFAAPEPWEEVCLGAEQHDAGMAAWDLDPATDAETGLPVDFMAMPIELHARLWHEGPERVRSQSRYAALLASMHCTALYDRRERTPVVAALLDHHARLQAELLDSLGEDPRRARHNQRLLWAWDWLSLAVLLDWSPGSQSVPTAEGSEDAELRLERAGDGRFALDPWPFRAGTLSVRAEGRRLRSASDPLSSAPWESVEIELVPAA